MGRPITDRRTGSLGGLCDSLDDERASELTFGELPLRRPDGANFTSLVPARAAAPSRAGALLHGNFGVHPDHPAVQALTAKTA